jgi:hypothetical protein
VKGLLQNPRNLAQDHPTAQTCGSWRSRGLTSGLYLNGSSSGGIWPGRTKLQHKPIQTRKPRCHPLGLHRNPRGPMGIRQHTVNPALLASSFVWQIQLYFHHISLFKIIQRKYFMQSKCEFMLFLHALYDKIKILPLYTVYLPHQLLHMLFFLPFRNF